MAVATRMLTVNAAFLREIKDDNRRLHALLEEVGAAIRHAAFQPHTARQLAESVGELRDQLALHFSLEEAYGYFEDAIEVAPRLNEQAEELRAQHRTLFVALCRVVDEAEQLLYREAPREMLAKIGVEFGKFLDDFRQHEAREADLILEAFDADVGVGD